MEPDQCPNCGSRLYGQFCYECGQNQKGIDRFFFSLLNETFEDVFSIRSRASRTLFNLMFRPGFLTREYFSGRRARYVPPLRLYLILSVLLFSYLAVLNKFTDLNVAVQGSDVVRIQADEESFDEAKKALKDEDIEVDLEGLEMPFMTPEENETFKEQLEAQFRKAAKKFSEDPGELVENILEAAPPILFVLVPVFALILKLVYFSHYYTEHLILAVHNHSFVFLTLLLSDLLDLFESTLIGQGTEVLSSLLGFWMVIYMYLSLKECYRQGTAMTLFKYLVLGFSYSILFTLAIVVALLYGALNA